MKCLPIAVAFVSFCLITFHANPAFAAVIDAGAPPEDAVVVPLELKESDDATAAAASVIDATPEEAASIPRRRRKLVTKKTGALDAQVAPGRGCGSDYTHEPSEDYKCSSGLLYCVRVYGGSPDTKCVLPSDPCYFRGTNERACDLYRKGLPRCYWYPHGRNDNPNLSWVGSCSISAGVSCGKHRASYCDQCPVYDNKDYGKRYCNGDCKWHSTFLFFGREYCENKHK